MEQPPYRDSNSPSSSNSSTLSNNNDLNSMKLKTNLISFGDTVKQKLGGLFKNNTENINNTPSSSTSPPTPTQPQTNHQHVANNPSSGGGRVFGRVSNNTGSHRNVIIPENDNESNASRSISPNPFLMAFSGGINRPQNSNVSPFARFDNNNNSRKSPPPSHNIFDDI
jgi:hypothetical protein